MKKMINKVLVVCYVMAALCLVSACNDSLDIQQVYPFSVEAMPVQKKIKKGETAEIRLKLKRDGRFKDTRYTVRFFQADGKGSLRLDDGRVLLSNDCYVLDKEVFRMYYVSETTEQQTIDLVFEDSFGQAQALTFSFNNDNREEEK